MTDTDTADLRARLEALEAENARLRADAAPGAAEAAPKERPRGTRWRAVLSILCIVVATILVPTSIAAAWTRVQLVDETRFVETFAPLAQDPDVQAVVADQVSTAIDASLDLEGLTDDLFDGIQQLDLPPRALAALDLLREPAAQGLVNLVDTTVTRLVQSEAFADVWETALRASHRALAAAAAGGTANGAVTIDSSGGLGIQLAPIIEEVKERLIDRGIGFASSIPVIDKTFVIVQSDALVLVGTVYNLAVAAGWWTPVAALVLFVLGILIARRRSTAVLGSGIGIALGATTLATGIGIGSTVLALSAPRLGVPPSALESVYEQVTGAMRDTAIVTALLGIVIAVIAWLSGRWRGAVASRRAVASVNTGVRRAARSRGIDTGRFGAWMYAQRMLVRIVLGALAILWLMLLRPLTVGEIFLVVIVWLLVWWVTELAQSRPDETGDVETDLADATAADTPDADALRVPDAHVDADTAVIDDAGMADTAVLAEADTAVIEDAAATEAAASPKKPRR